MPAASEIKPAYLITGTDEGRIALALRRLRARALREGGPGALESFGPADAGAPPDASGLIAAIPALSLLGSRRYLVADGLERLDARALEALAAALADLPADVTVVLVERPAQGRRGRPPAARAKARAALAEAVKAAGGEALELNLPPARELPRWLVREAKRLGFALEPEAARLLVERMGERTERLANELERLALWAGPGGAVRRSDLEAMVADTSETAIWALADAIVARDPAAAVAAAERLTAQGEAIGGLIYQAARRLREAHAALRLAESGRSEREIAAELRAHPYAAKMLLRRLRGARLEELQEATRAVADLEWWTRGGSSYPQDVALTLAVRRAAGAGLAVG